MQHVHILAKPAMVQELATVIINQVVVKVQARHVQDVLLMVHVQVLAPPR